MVFLDRTHSHHIQVSHPAERLPMQLVCLQKRPPPRGSTVPISVLARGRHSATAHQDRWCSAAPSIRCTSLSRDPIRGRYTDRPPSCQSRCAETEATAGSICKRNWAEDQLPQEHSRADACSRTRNAKLPCCARVPTRSVPQNLLGHASVQCQAQLERLRPAH